MKIPFLNKELLHIKKTLRHIYPQQNGKQSAAKGGYSIRRRMRHLYGLSAVLLVIMFAVVCFSAIKSNDWLFLSSVILLMVAANSLVLGSSMRGMLRDSYASGTLHQGQEEWLTNKYGFYQQVNEYIAVHPDCDPVIVRWDIDRFKAYNDIFGTHNSESMLHKLERMGMEAADIPGVVGYAHYEADHFVSCWDSRFYNEQHIITDVTESIRSLFEPYQVSLSFGFCRVERSVDIGVLCDRALMALRSVKHDYERSYAWYDDSMRTALLTEQLTVSTMEEALDSGKFEIWYQPQVNYENGCIIGAEALVRWRWPERGLVGPADFIPVFEDNGFICRLDKYVWESVCRQQGKWRDAGMELLPVSVNVSRRDLMDDNIVQILTDNVHRYDIPPELLRLEITESAYNDNPQQLIARVNELHANGFHVELDDFGSGYSSLNVLKNTEVDMLKLDMGFINDDSPRSGNILSSVVRLAHNINLPVLAEGVENTRQAEYLKSIGCIYMQGYMFGQPMTADDYCELCRRTAGQHELLSIIPEADNAAEFLDANTQATLLFNSFVGGAAILEYGSGGVVLLRSNDRLWEMIGINREDFPFDNADELNRLSEPSRAVALELLEQAMNSGKEASGVLMADGFPGDPIWLEVHVRHLARKMDADIFYMSAENITAEHKLQEQNARLSSELWAMLRNAPCGIARMTRVNGKVEYRFVSASLARMLGYEPDELRRLLKKDPLFGIHPDDRERVMNAHRPEGYAGVISQHYRIRHKNGSYLCCSVRSSMIGEPENCTIYVAYSDITDIYLAEAVLRSAAMQIDSLICLYDIRAHTLKIQPGMAEKYDCFETIPDMCESMIAGGYIADESITAWREMSAAIERGESGTVKALCIRRLSVDEWRWYTVSYGPVDTGDELQEATVVFRDITSNVVGAASDANDSPASVVVTVEDNTSLHGKATEFDRLQVNESILRAAAAHSGRMIYFCPSGMRELKAMDSAAAAESGLPTQITLDSLYENSIILPDSGDMWRGLPDELQRGAESAACRMHLSCADGAARWFDVRCSLLRGDDVGSGYVVSLLDITEEHIRCTVYELFQQLLADEQRDSLLIMDVDLSADRVEYVSAKGGLVCELPPDIGCDESLNLLTEQNCITELRSRILARLGRDALLGYYTDGKRMMERDWMMPMADSSESRLIHCRIRLIRDVFNDHIHAFWIVADASAEQQREYELIRRAEHDSLTGLYNRGALQQYISACRKAGALNFFVLIDLDDMKHVNNTYGHQYGDMVLRHLAGLLQKHFCDPQAMVARMGGDEFAVFQPAISSAAEQMASMDQLYNELSHQRIGSQRLRIRCCSGCVLSDSDHDGFDAMYGKADVALYHVKCGNKNDFAFFNADMLAKGNRYLGLSHKTTLYEQMYGGQEMEMLIEQLARIYPVLISINLDQQRYYLMEYRDRILPELPAYGSLDKLRAIPGSGWMIADAGGECSMLAVDFPERLHRYFEQGCTALRRFYCFAPDGGDGDKAELLVLMYRSDSNCLCCFVLGRRCRSNDERTGLPTECSIMAEKTAACAAGSDTAAHTEHDHPRQTAMQEDKYMGKDGSNND